MANTEWNYYAKLAERIKKQDSDAFVELYNQTYQKVYFLALSILNDEYLAQDVVQETFIQVYKSIHTLKDNMLLLAWINRIAYHCSLKLMAKNGNFPVGTDLKEFGADAIEKDEPLEAVLSKEQNQTIMDMILELAPEYKTALILKYYEGLKLEEIAESLECNIGTVKSRLSRGKQALRKKIMSNGKFFLLLFVSGFSISFTLKSYAQENIMTAPLAQNALEASKSSLGLKTCAEFKALPVQAAAVSIMAKITIASLSALALATTGTFFAQKPEIHVTYAEEDQNGAVPVTIQVVSTVPLKLLTVSFDGSSVPVYPGESENSYHMVAASGGLYQVDANLLNGRSAEKQFEISSMDKTAPELYWYNWDSQKNSFYGLIRDNESGIDYSRICEESSDGKKFPPIAYQEETGQIEFQLLEVPFYIQLFDKCGNYASYKIESYLYEEDQK